MLNELLLAVDEYLHQILKMLPKLALSIIVFMFFVISSKKVIRFFLKKISKIANDKFLYDIIFRLLKWTYVICGFVIALNIMGLGSFAGGIATGAGLSAVVIGFAFKNIGENFVSGIILAFQKPFDVGDFIETSDYSGNITTVGLRTTNIKTADGNDIFIPNSMILNNPLINFSMDTVRRFDFTLQLDFGIDVDKVRKILMDEFSINKDILKDPASFIMVDMLTSNVVVKCYYWLNTKTISQSLLETKSKVIENSLSVLLENGIDVSDISQIKLTNDFVKLGAEHIENKNENKVDSKSENEVESKSESEEENKSENENKNLI